jgi:hypothetical protein
MKRSVAEVKLRDVPEHLLVMCLVLALHAPAAPITDADWAPMNAIAGTNGDVAASVYCNGALYCGGKFTAAGTSFCNRIAKWDGKAWSALGTGMDSTVTALACDKTGNIYSGGKFLRAGVASCGRLVEAGRPYRARGWKALRPSAPPWSPWCRGWRDGCYVGDARRSTDGPEQARYRADAAADAPMQLPGDSG